MRLTTDRDDRFAFGPDEFWARIDRVSDYPAWWPWLRHFDGDQLSEGAVWQCVVQPPVPYTVRFQITIDHVDPLRSVSASISGDIVGTAHLHVEPDADGCRTRLVSELAPAKESLRIMSLAARPIVKFGHNWVMAVGMREFRARSA